MCKSVILTGNSGKCVFFFRFTVSEKDTDYFNRTSLASGILNLSLIEWLKTGGLRYENRC